MTTSGQQIKGIKCPRCGAENEQGEAHCFNCNTFLTPIIETSPKGVYEGASETKGWIILLILIFGGIAFSCYVASTTGAG